MQRRGRGRPPSPPPLVFWRLRLDLEPPQVCKDAPNLAKLLGWQITLVRERHVDSETITEPITGVRAYIVEDNGEKHRFLRRFGVASNAIHGHLVLENEPPAGGKAIVRVRGLDLPSVAELPLASAEKVDKNLFDQPAEQLARAALERDDVREMLLTMLSKEKPPPKKAASGGG